jgi:DNA-binding response OmpR family regulator
MTTGIVNMTIQLKIRAGMNLGADDYVTKPIPKADLLAP